MGKPVRMFDTCAHPTACCERPVKSAARVGEHSGVTWIVRELQPPAASASTCGVSMSEPKQPNWAKPVSSSRHHHDVGCVVTRMRLLLEEGLGVGERLADRAGKVFDRVVGRRSVGHDGGPSAPGRVGVTGGAWPVSSARGRPPSSRPGCVEVAGHGAAGRRGDLVGERLPADVHHVWSTARRTGSCPVGAAPGALRSPRA